MQKGRAEIPALIEPGACEIFRIAGPERPGPGPNDLGHGLEVFRAPLPTAYFVRDNCG